MKKLLVIDDQPQVLEIVSYLLGASGYAVATAKNGKEGLDAARLLKPDLIICDVMMPGMSGYDVLQAARQDAELVTTPFVFLTAKATPEDLRAGMTLGADDYLTKPFTEEQLLAAVQTQLDKHTAVNDRFQQKLDLLRQGLSTVLPHELRTPLTLILAHTSLLLETAASLDRPTIVDMVQTIHDSSLRLHRLLENLLAYVSTEGDESLLLENPHTEHARPVVLEAATKRSETHKRQQDLRTEVEDGALKMHPFHLRKIVEELVDNAFKFSAAGSPVSISTGQDQGAFVLMVSDQGRGMLPAQIENIGAYVQFKRYIFEQQGAGVGLALSKRLVELYGGTLNIETEPDRGTTIQIRIPSLWQNV